jgi:hypothetical protein
VPLACGPDSRLAWAVSRFAGLTEQHVDGQLRQAKIFLIKILYSLFRFLFRRLKSLKESMAELGVQKLSHTLAIGP